MGAVCRRGARRKGRGPGGALHTPSYPSGGQFETPPGFRPRPYPVHADRPVRIYCDGIYDVFHYGHARQLMQAKHLFPSVHLIVGVCSDELTRRYKGACVMGERERYESVRHCRYVDEVVEDAPWVLDEEFLRRHRIDYVAHDDIPYAVSEARECTDDAYAFLKASGRFIPTLRTRGISTTGIITRIVRDYDAFVKTQVLRGMPRRDLNISFFRESRLRMNYEIEEIARRLGREVEEVTRRLVAEVGEMKDSFLRGQARLKRRVATRLNSEVRELLLLLGQWEALSGLWLKSFLERFGSMRDGWIDRIVGLVRRGRPWSVNE